MMTATYSPSPCIPRSWSVGDVEGARELVRGEARVALRALRARAVPSGTVLGDGRHDRASVEARRPPAPRPQPSAARRRPRAARGTAGARRGRRGRRASRGRGGPRRGRARPRAASFAEESSRPLPVPRSRSTRRRGTSASSESPKRWPISSARRIVVIVGRRGVVHAVDEGVEIGFVGDRQDEIELDALVRRRGAERSPARGARVAASATAGASVPATTSTTEHDQHPSETAARTRRSGRASGHRYRTVSTMSTPVALRRAWMRLVVETPRP